jgi:hypothetical protein
MAKVRKYIDDLGAAAYIMMHHYEVIGKRRGKSSYCFEIEEEDIDKINKLYRTYLNSEFHRFDSCIMSLKKIGEIAEDYD